MLDCDVACRSPCPLWLSSHEGGGWFAEREVFYVVSTMQVVNRGILGMFVVALASSHAKGSLVLVTWEMLRC